MAEPLEQAALRVVEVGDGPGVRYAGRILAGFRADVARTGEPGASAPASVPEQSLAAWRRWLDTGKRVVAAAELPAALAQADVVLDGRAPAEREAEPLALREGCTLVAASWFGEDGPYARHAGADLVCRALAGLVKLAGPAEGPPVTVPDFQVEVMAGLSVFTAAAAALLGGGGRRMEVSALEAAIAFAEYQLAQVDVLGPARRLGINVFRPNYPVGVYRCREGWIGMTVVTVAQWQACCELLGMHEEAADPRYITSVGRLAGYDRLEARLREGFLRRSAQEWFEAGRARRLPWVVVPTMSGLAQLPVFTRRGAIESHALAGRPFLAPAIPFRPAEGGGLPPAPRGPGGAGRKRPLEGLRVVDFSMGWAGPLATRQLADMGAEIIKVEACQYTDWWRGHDPRPAFFEGRGYEKSPWFNAMNRNKKGITLDLGRPEGVALALQLVRDADAVVENYAPEVLPKLGLDYARLSTENPRLVMLSLPAFAGDGEWADVRAYGSTLEHASGLPMVTGVEGGAPAMNHLAYGDANGGLNGAAALLAALLEVRRTGRGRHVVVSQVEAMLPLAAYWMIHETLHGFPAPREGLGHPLHAPHGCFPCAGDDAWVALAVTSDVQWDALARLLGDPDLQADAGLRDAGGRKRNEARIQVALRAWAARYTPEEAARQLQAAGIPAAPVLAPADLPADPHLQRRGFWQRVERAHVAPQVQASAPMREGGVPYPVRSPAPTLGEHGEQVLAERLGLDAARLAQLRADGVIGTEATGGKVRSRLRTPASALS